MAADDSSGSFSNVVAQEDDVVWRKSQRTDVSSSAHASGQQVWFYADLQWWSLPAVSLGSCQRTRHSPVSLRPESWSYRTEIKILFWEICFYCAYLVKHVDCVRFIPLFNVLVGNVPQTGFEHRDAMPRCLLTDVTCRWNAAGVTHAQSDTAILRLQPC